MSPTAPQARKTRPDTAFVGLAPFLRLSIAGIDFQGIGQQLLSQAQSEPDNANLWMNLATVLLCLEQREAGLAVQSCALELQRTYHLAATLQPARCRLLMLLMPGDLSANTPLDCLLENSDVDLDFHYISTGDPLASPIPEHDVLLVGLSACDESRAALASLEILLADWPKPVLNAPQHLPCTMRDTASQRLQNVPGLLIPPTLRADRQTLLAIAAGASRLPQEFKGCDFPVILRPLNSHGGHGLEKINSPAALDAYLAGCAESHFFLSPFIDYSGADGLFRKCRIALIDGQPFACHMAISAHWMVHYLNADMYADAQKREEEAFFMAHFADFAQRHRGALAAIAQRTRLDYVCIDCAETRDGQLLIFEIDHAMVVHAMDQERLFPHKQIQMQKVKTAFRDLLLQRMADAAPVGNPRKLEKQ